MVLIRLGRWTVSMLWQLIASVIILLCVSVIMLKALMPLMPANRSFIAEQISRVSGAEVEISEMSTQWQHLKPSLVLGDVKFISEGVRLEAGNIRMHLDFPASILHKTAVFEQLSFDDVQVIVDSSGKKNKRADGFTGLNMQNIFRFIFSSSNIRVGELQADLLDASGKHFGFELKALNIGNAGDYHWMTGELRLDNEQENISLLAEYTGPADRPFSGIGKLYTLASSRAVTHDSLAFLMEQLSASANSVLHLQKNANAEGELWFTWQKGDMNLYMDGKVRGLLFETLGETREMDVSAIIRADANFKDDYRFQMSDTDLTVSGHKVVLPLLDINFNEKSCHFRSASNK